MIKPIHFSHLKHMQRSPAHYLHAATTGIEQTRPMRIGSVVHALVLGGEFHVYEGEARRGKEWKAFEAEHQDGKVIVTAPELADARPIAMAVHTDPVARWALEELQATETEIRWSYLGRECSSRLDAVTPHALVELKVTNCADPQRFARQAIWMSYHAQLAFYLRALGEEPQETQLRALVIAVEDRAPHPVTVLQLTARALDAGDRLCRLWMERVLACEAAGEWPGYVQTVQPLDLPDWGEEQAELIIDGEAVAL